MPTHKAFTIAYDTQEIIVRHNNTYRTYKRSIDKLKEIDRKLEKSFIQKNIHRMSYSIFHTTYTNKPSETLYSLIRSAERSATWRGHTLVWTDIDIDRATAICAVCGRRVLVDTKPAPNGIDIAGEAVALNCDD